MRSVTDESTKVTLELTSESLEVMLWLRRHNSTSQCLDGERHGPLWFWTQPLPGSLWVWFDISGGEERQNILSDTEGRRR
jgi:hypothetical protein